MEKTKRSKKALKKLINASLRDAISSLELPKANKKVKQLLDRNSKKLAGEFRTLIKKAKKTAKKNSQSVAFIEDVFSGKANRKKDKKAVKGNGASLESAQV